MKQETFLLSSENDQVECPSCKEKYTNNQGAGVSNHLRTCCPKAYLWFIIPTIMNRSINILDLLQCFERNAPQTFQWFEGIWGSQYSWARLRGTVRERARGKTIKRFPDLDPMVYKEIAEYFIPTTIWDYDYKASPLYPDMKQTLESLPDYESFQPLIFGDSNYTISEARDHPTVMRAKLEVIPNIIPKPIALPEGHYHKDTETVCITEEQYEYLKKKDVDLAVIKAVCKAQTIEVAI